MIVTIFFTKEENLFRKKEKLEKKKLAAEDENENNEPLIVCFSKALRIALHEIDKKINELKNSKATLMQCYPIGSIYTSANPTNPSVAIKEFGTTVYAFLDIKEKIPL